MVGGGGGGGGGGVVCVCVCVCVCVYLCVCVCVCLCVCMYHPKRVWNSLLLQGLEFATTKKGVFLGARPFFNIKTTKQPTATSCYVRAAGRLGQDL